MIFADPDAFAAVYATLLCNDRFMISDSYRLGRASLDTIDTPLAQVRIQADRVRKYVFVVQCFTPYCCVYC